jgi:hypothetical protein
MDKSQVTTSSRQMEFAKLPPRTAMLVDKSNSVSKIATHVKAVVQDKYSTHKQILVPPKQLQDHHVLDVTNSTTHKPIAARPAQMDKSQVTISSRQMVFAELPPRTAMLVDKSNLVSKIATHAKAVVQDKYSTHNPILV